MNKTHAGWGRRLLLAVVLSFSLFAYTAQSVEGQTSAVVQTDEDPAICFLIIGSGCVHAAFLCDNSPIPGNVCDALFEYCIMTGLDICFGAT